MLKKSKAVRFNLAQNHRAGALHEAAMATQKPLALFDAEANSCERLLLGDFFDILVPSAAENDELASRLLAPVGSAMPESLVLEGPANVPAAKPRTTSIKVFKRHLFHTELGSEGAGQAIVDGVISHECYNDWLSTRSRAPAKPEKTFHRTLTCTVSGTDGRQPFTPEEEVAVLTQLRVKRVWPAFANASLPIGSKGFRGCVLHSCGPRADPIACAQPRLP